MSKIDETVDTIKTLVTDAVEEVLYDDYFTDENDPGVVAVVEHLGKKLKFRVKKSLTLSEKQLASSAAVSFSLDKDGNPTITKMDQAAYTSQVVLAGVKSWPFKYRSGEPVPINRLTVSRMDGTLAEKVAAVILGQREAQQKALDPFAPKSDVAS